MYGVTGGIASILKLTGVIDEVGKVLDDSLNVKGLAIVGTKDSPGDVLS
jgi:hypothetical protein